jgi:beta-phosphoglucomutase
MITAIVFDFDGVLADSEVLHLRAYQEVLTPRGIALSRDEYFARYLGFDDEGVFRTLADDRHVPLTRADIETLIAEKGQVFDALEKDTDVLYPGAARCVRALATEFPLGIASGALRHEIEAVLVRSGLLGFFRFVVASGDTPASKPAPDPYRRAIELHRRLPNECLAIEDSRWGIASAKSAGLWCIGITHTYARSELMGADLTIDALDDFTPDLIRSLGVRR